MHSREIPKLFLGMQIKIIIIYETKLLAELLTKAQLIHTRAWHLQNRQLLFITIVEASIL
jgi:hypothetical protein